MHHGRFTKIISSIALFAILVSQGCYFPASFAADEQDVSISISPKPKVDIVLSKARSKANTNQFEADIKQALIARNIDSDDVNVSAVSAEQVNIETAFSWQSDVSSSIGSLSIANNGQNVVMYGNRTNPGKNAIWIEPDGNQEQKFTFGYNIDFGDSFNAAGMLLRVKETNKSNHTLSGYMLSFNNSDWNSSSGGYNGAIWKFLYDGNNTSNMTKTLVRGLSINKSGTLTVSATDSEIKISGGGLSSEITCEIDENYTTGNGFGFFSDHYSHNCDSIGSFQLTNINLTAVTTKSFKEVLQLPEWREGSLRFLVNVDDYTNDELNDQTAYSELLTKLMNEDIDYIAWGNAKNEEQFENLIAANSSKGVFTLNTNYNTAIDTTADYIKQIVDANTTDISQYVVVNEPININVRPEGIMTNTTDAEWPYGKWQINHEHTYYENDMGQFAESGKLIDSLITTFDKTGKYEIFYKNLPVYPREIYVHRKPIAAIGLERGEDSVTLTSLSYDLDQMSSENNGISEEAWQWKVSDDSNWTDGKLTIIDPSKDYIVSLKVKDNQETWSNATTLYITSNANSAPVALFSIAATNISKYEELEIVDASYDPAGGEIVSYDWEVYKGNTLIYSGHTPKTSFLNDEIGEYTYYLKVTNARGKVSEKFGRKVTITDDNYAPEVVIMPTSSDWGTSQTIHLEFTDKGGSGFKHYKYAITENQSIPETWSEPISRSSDDIVINSNGIKYLHVIAEDNAGNISNDRITGTYNMDNSRPEITVTGDLDTPVIDELTLNIKTTDYLSGIKTITINGTEISSDIDCKFTKNGTYTVIAEDNVGNTTTKTITINNIYYNCTNGLEHPAFSSSFDSCPICAAFEGLALVQNTKVYNSELQGISYSNPSNAQIVEYYNNINSQVENVGRYNYSLKVLFDGVEYNTGIDGIFTILPKVITIENIETQTKQYDTNNVIQITGGEIVGAIPGDDVAAIVPSTGLAESANAGNWKVSIDDITLTGEDSFNYALTQPEYGSIMANIITTTSDLIINCNNKIYDGMPIVPSKVSGLNTSEVVYTYYEHNKDIPIDRPIKAGTYDVIATQITDGNYNAVTSNKVTFTISPKTLTIENVQALDREYNTTDTVQIVGGNLIGIVGNDDVRAIVPADGKTENSNTGNWKVSIDDIILTGEDAFNYNLVQPEYGSIMANITRATSDLIIACGDKIYDGTEIIPKYMSGLNTSEINYTYYNHDTNEVIDTPITVGKYDVIAHQETDGNYNAVTSNKVTFTISPKELTIENLKAENKRYDTTDIIEITGGKLVGIVGEDNVSPVIPKTGKSENSNTGNWKVSIDDITLTGEDAFNYVLIQPEYGSLTVKIIQAIASLAINCEDKIYDGKVPLPEKISGENSSNLTYIYYEHGKDEKIEAPTKAGTYDVQAYQESDGNYKETASKKITFMIKPKEITIKDIVAKEKEADSTDIIYISGGELEGVLKGDDVKFVLPKTGTSEKTTSGTWDVKIEEITLTGKDATNYTLKQPAKGDIKVKISERAPDPIPQTGEIAVPIIVSSISITTLSLGFVILKKFILK